MSEMSDRNGSMEEVEHPSHYQSDGVECIDAMYAISPAMAVCFAAGSAIKYLDRAGLKDDEGQDLRKAHKSDYARGSSLVCDLGDGEIVGPDGFCSWGEPADEDDEQ